MDRYFGLEQEAFEAKMLHPLTLAEVHSNCHGARPVHLISTIIKWIRTSRLSINNALAEVFFFFITLKPRVE